VKNARKANYLVILVVLVVRTGYSRRPLTENSHTTTYLAVTVVLVIRIVLVISQRSWCK